KGATDTASRRKIFVCRPSTSRDEEACARRIVTTLAKHAFRRPATQTDVKTLMEFYQEGRGDGGSFDEASKRRSSGCWQTPSSSRARSANRPTSLPAKRIA